MRYINILIMGCLLLYSCSSSLFNCDIQKDDIQSEWGSPEEIAIYSSTTYNSLTWWYWSKGVGFMFIWGSSIRAVCDMSRYEFDPILPTATAEEKASIKITLKGIY